MISSRRVEWLVKLGYLAADPAPIDKGLIAARQPAASRRRTRSSTMTAFSAAQRSISCSA
jgi:hypothetical protein